MSVVSHITVHSTPTLVAIFHAKIPETLVIDLNSTLPNYGCERPGQTRACLVDRVDSDEIW